MSEETVAVRKEKSRKFDLKNMLKVKSLLIALVVVLSLGAALYYWQDARDARSQTPEAVAERNQEETARVLGAINDVLLTESESDPTVARIEDAEILRGANPDFYRNAQNGDYLILYPQRAIIYRESEDLIVNVAPIINTADIAPQENGDGSDSESN